MVIIGLSGYITLKPVHYPHQKQQSFRGPMDTFMTLFPAFFIVLGIILIAVGQSQQRKARVVGTWPTVPGVILTSDLQEHYSTDDEGGATYTYEPVIDYSYRFMGVQYTGTEYRMGSKGASYDQKRAQTIVDRYPVDLKVDVRYNPDNPAVAVLELGSASASILMLVGVIFAVVGAVILIVFMFV
jgi:hypothetical protein